MRPTKAIVRLDAIVHNLGVAARLAPGSKNVPVIKANAYGHGAVEVARALAPHAPALALACMDEAVALREAGIDHPLLVLQGPNSAGDVAEAASSGIWLMLQDPRQVRWAAATRLRTPLTAWLKVDTGMHRLGLAPDTLPQAVAALRESDCARDEMVISTHLSSADETDSRATTDQLAAFNRATAGLALPRSIANSAGILYWPDTHAEWNRPGYLLYGNEPAINEGPAAAPLKPVMTLASEVIAVRTIEAGEGVGYGLRWRAERRSRIGTIPVGYGDGYPRHAPSGTPVRVNGVNVPLVGIVSMDAITVDLSDVEDAGIGSPVELWGANLSVNDVAQSAGTIGYELLAGLTARVPVESQGHESRGQSRGSE